MDSLVLTITELREPVCQFPAAVRLRAPASIPRRLNTLTNSNGLGRRPAPGSAGGSGVIRAPARAVFSSVLRETSSRRDQRRTSDGSSVPKHYLRERFVARNRNCARNTRHERGAARMVIDIAGHGPRKALSCDGSRRTKRGAERLFGLAH